MKYLFLLVIALLMSCGNNDNKIVSGGGTDVSNARIMGVVLGSDSLPVAGAVVRLYPNGSNPYLNLSTGTSKSFEVKTNALGEYEILVRDTGDYVLDLGLARTNEKAFRFGIRLNADSLVRHEKVVLTKPGALQITIPNGLREKEGLYAYVPGTAYFQMVDESKVLEDSLYVFTDLPSGILPSVHFAVINDKEIDESHVLEIEIKESDTTDVIH